MSEGNAAVVAIYDTHAHAEEAVRTLQKAGFDMKKLSIVGKDFRTEEQVVGFYNRDDRVKFWGGTGALWGGIWGLLLGTAIFAIPGIGPVLVGGPLAASLVAGLESAVVVGGLSAVGAALYSSGIPKDSIVRYETALRADNYLVMVHGTSDDVAKAGDILATASASSVDQHALQPAAAANENVERQAHA
jgi:hypothetical protein